MEDRMRCTCEQARREARAEAFEEIAEWCEDERQEDGGLALHSIMDAVEEHCRALAAAERAPHAPKPPVRYTEAPEPETPPAEADGFTTEHATGWPKRLIPDWPDSYPFEALGPWPGADGGRDGA
jgi:hypothetical protein